MDAPRTRVPAGLPNAISCLRIALVPVFVVLAQRCNDAARAGDPTAPDRSLALLVLALIGVSDLLDGYLARKHGLTTPLGATLDALADKLAQVALLVDFTWAAGPAFPAVPAWFTLLVLGRDVVLATGSLLVRHHRGAVRVVHRAHGKLTSLVMFGLLIAISADVQQSVVAGALLAVATLVTLSTLAYMRDGFAQVRVPEGGD